jgi:hypothetical protein
MIIAGVIGSLLMSIVMTFIHRGEWANADMIRAVGSLVTKSYEHSLLPGLAIHYGVGTLLAIPYTLILETLAIHSPVALAGVGATLGLFHGAAMSFVLLALVADNHPVKRFRSAGIDVAAAHVAGHVAYGLGVGGACALLALASGMAV